ncbi:hypothetical protein RFI_31191, partial [Reticulomyxa filosa]
MKSRHKKTLAYESLKYKTAHLLCHFVMTSASTQKKRKGYKSSQKKKEPKKEIVCGVNFHVEKIFSVDNSFFFFHFKSKIYDQKENGTWITYFMKIFCGSCATVYVCCGNKKNIYKVNLRKVPMNRSWNSLKIFCYCLLVFVIIRAITFSLHFLFYAADVNMTMSILDITMNLLFLLPSFIFLLVFMILCCIWIEITLFSRDQDLLSRDKYGKIWRYSYIAIFFFMLSALIVTYVVCAKNGSNSNELAAALFRSLWIMQLFIPTCAFSVYVFSVVRFAGFPFINHVWQQQSKRMNLVILVWTFGDLLEGTMLSIWANNDIYDWEHHTLAFQISV